MLEFRMQEEEMLPDVARYLQGGSKHQRQPTPGGGGLIRKWARCGGGAKDPNIPHGPWSLPTIPPHQTPTVIPHVALAAAHEEHEGLSGDAGYIGSAWPSDGAMTAFCEKKFERRVLVEV
jgi:hypothetical protein